MATVEIHYDRLDDTATRFRSVASEMDAYADALPGNVSNPLNSLTGGSSGFTSSAVSLASAKARSLRDRAEQYRSAATKVESFKESAKAADDMVAERMRELADRRDDDLSWWDKIKVGLFNVLTDLFDNTAIGDLVRDILNKIDFVAEFVERGLKAVGDWFKHGGGRYLLDVVLKAIDLASSVFLVMDFLTAFAAMAAWFFPVGAIIGCILVGAAIFVTVKKTIDLGVTADAAAKGWQYGASDEPGLARYYGETGSLSDWTKKYTTNAALQQGTKVFDVAADTTDFVLGFASMGFSKNADGLVDGYSLPKNFGESFAGKFGFTKTEQGTWQFFKGDIFGLQSMLDSKSDAEFSRNTMSSVKSTLSFFDTGMTLGEGLRSHSRDKYTPLDVGMDYLSMWGNAFSDFGVIGDITSGTKLYTTYARMK